MTPGVRYALLSMLFAGLNDIVFKKYSAKERSRGMYVLGIGVVWAVLQVLFMRAVHRPFDLEKSTLLYGVIAGALLTASNILLIESLAHIDVSLGSTLYRLNTIGVVLLSFLFLGEAVGAVKAGGIALGVGAVLVLYAGRTPVRRAKAGVFFWLAVSASFCRALYGVLSKAGLAARAEPQSLLLLSALCWIAGGALYARWVEKRFVVTGKKVIYSLLSGCLVFGIVNFLVLGLARGQATVVIPIANMSFVVALIISLALKLEAPAPKKVLAACLAIASIALLSGL